MGLDAAQIRTEIREGRKRKTIAKAVAHQNRVRFHAQAELSPRLAQPVADFLAYVGNLIPADKLKMFKTLFRYPVKTNELCDVCFNRLSRVFEGFDPAFEYRFSDPGAAGDWEAYRRDALREPEVWAQRGWEFFKTEINSVLVVDMPAQPNAPGTLPAPYFYWLPIGQVAAYETDGGNAMRWIAFRQEGGRLAVIDDERYRVFEERDGNIGALLADNPHGLGYCPARFFWSESLSLEEPDVKASPLTKELESMDWYLFYHLSKRHLDMYGSYPIYSGYEQSCDFTNGENGDYCDGGFLKDRQGFYKMDASGIIARCPKCGDKRIAGVGSFVEIPVPDGDKQPDLRNPVQMLTVDRSSLDYNVGEEERLREAIITSVTGRDDAPTAREALNETQVRATFESQTTVLKRVKKGFEQAIRFVDETVCRLRYGGAFLSASVSLGTDFYASDPSELRRRYNEAKAGGAGEAELDALRARAEAAEFKSSPALAARLRLLHELEPFPNLTAAEAADMHAKGIITDKEMRVKADFAALVRRFERENTDISDFASALPFAKKIEIITEKLYEYVSDIRQ